MLKPTEKVVQLKKLVKDVEPYIESQADRKQGIFDKRSEDWQLSDKGMDAQDDISNLTDLQSLLSDLHFKLDETYEF